MSQVSRSRTLQAAQANWTEWENKFRRISADVAVNGICAGAIEDRYRFHTAKCMLFLVAFAILHFVSTGQRPAFQQLSFIKLVLFGMLFEALGLGCSSGPLGGHTGSTSTKCPLFWHNTHVGSCKLPSFAALSKTRDALHIAAYLTYLATLLFLLCTATPRNLAGSGALLVLFAFLAYFWATDRVVFLSSRPEYYGQFLLCLYFAEGWLLGCQALQLMVWFWAGVSKLGLWFAYVNPVMTASSPLATGDIKTLYRHFPKDLRPSAKAFATSSIGVALELGAALLMCCPGAYARYLGLACAALLHGFIIASFPVGAVAEWNHLSQSSRNMM